MPPHPERCWPSVHRNKAQFFIEDEVPLDLSQAELVCVVALVPALIPHSSGCMVTDLTLGSAFNWPASQSANL